MSSTEDDELFNAIAPIVDTILYLKKVEHSISDEVFEYAIKCRDELWKQVEKRLALYNDEVDKEFVYESTFNFLLFSMRKLIAHLDNDSIEYIANEVKNKLMNLKEGK